MNPDDLSTGYYGSAYRSPEDDGTAKRYISTLARRGIISDRFVEAILVLARKVSGSLFMGMSLFVLRVDNKKP